MLPCLGFQAEAFMSQAGNPNEKQLESSQMKSAGEWKWLGLVSFFQELLGLTSSSAQQTLMSQTFGGYKM